MNLAGKKRLPGEEKGTIVGEHERDGDIDGCLVIMDNGERCDNALKFIGSRRLYKLGYCEFWFCPVHKTVVGFAEDGSIIGEED